MSVISDILAKGLSVLATAKGESVGYRTGTAGLFTALSGFVLTQDRVPVTEYDEQIGAEKQKKTATLKGPTTPIVAKGYQVQDLVTGIIWAVQSNKLDVQQICLLETVDPGTHTPNRGGAA